MSKRAWSVWAVTRCCVTRVLPPGSAPPNFVTKHATDFQRQVGPSPHRHTVDVGEGKRCPSIHSGIPPSQLD